MEKEGLIIQASGTYDNKESIFFRDEQNNTVDSVKAYMATSVTATNKFVNVEQNFWGTIAEYENGDAGEGSKSEIKDFRKWNYYVKDDAKYQHFVNGQQNISLAKASRGDRIDEDSEYAESFKYPVYGYRVLDTDFFTYAKKQWKEDGLNRYQEYFYVRNFDLDYEDEGYEYDEEDEEDVEHYKMHESPHFDFFTRFYGKFVSSFQSEYINNISLKIDDRYTQEAFKYLEHFGLFFRVDNTTNRIISIYPEPDIILSDRFGYTDMNKIHLINNSDTKISIYGENISKRKRNDNYNFLLATLIGVLLTITIDSLFLSRKRKTD